MEQNDCKQEISKITSSFKEPLASENEIEKNRRVEEKESYQLKKTSTKTSL